MFALGFVSVFIYAPNFKNFEEHIVLGLFICPHGFFLCSLGPNSAQWNLGDFFPNFEKKSQSSFFFLDDWDFHSVNTHTQVTW